MTEEHYILLPERHTYPFIELKTDFKNLLWVDGRRIPPPVPFLEFFFEPDKNTSLPLPDYVSPSAGIPLFSRALAKVFIETGVDSIEYFDASITNQSTGECTEYLAANILRLVECVDRERSEYSPSFGSDLLIGDFDHLEIDESKIQGERLFRLAERSLLALVHSEVKAAIEKAGLRGMTFVAPKDWNCLTTTT